MTDDPADRNGIRIDRRWFRIGIVLFALYTVATVVAVQLLRFDHDLGLPVVLVGSVLSGWLLVIYFVFIHD